MTSRGRPIYKAASLLLWCRHDHRKAESIAQQEDAAGAMVDVIAMRVLLQEAKRREQDAKHEAQAQADQLHNEIRRL